MIMMRNLEVPRSSKRAPQNYPAGHWPTRRAPDTVTCCSIDRYRRRLRMLGDGGLDFCSTWSSRSSCTNRRRPEAGGGGFVEGGGRPERTGRGCAARDAASFRASPHLGNRPLPPRSGRPHPDPATTT